VPEVKVEEPKIQKALDLGNLKSLAAAAPNAQKQWNFAIKAVNKGNIGVQFQDKLKHQQAQATWALLISKTKKKINEIKETRANDCLINLSPADLVEMLDKRIY